MLLELAVGDAYGAGFEYVPVDLIRKHNTATHYIHHPKHNIRPGCYTDDTQMSLAAASCSGEYAQDLPASLLDTLENGRYGRDYLLELDRQLLALTG